MALEEPKINPNLTEEEFLAVKIMVALQLPGLKEKRNSLSDSELKRADLLACFETAENPDEAFQNANSRLGINNKVAFNMRVKVWLLESRIPSPAPEVLTDEEWQVAREFYRRQLARVQEMYGEDIPSSILSSMMMTHALARSETLEDALQLGALTKTNRPFDPVIFSEAVRTTTGIRRRT